MTRWVAMLLALVSGLAAADGARVTLVFRAHTLVDTAAVRLADVAEVHVADAALRQRLATLRVGTVPQVGVHRVVTRQRVLAMIAANDDRLTLVPTGANRTVVTRSAHDFRAASLIRTAKSYLDGYLHEHYPGLARIDIEPVGVVQDLRLPQGKVTVRPRAVQGDDLAARVCVWVDVAVRGRAYRSVPVWLNVKAYAPVLVARRALSARVPTVPSDFVVEQRDLARLRGTPLYDPNTVVGMRTRVRVRGGAVVRAVDLERNPPVLANQEVYVHVVAGPVRIQTRAVAEQEGYVGEYVRVRNPQTSSVFKARVTGEKSVQVTQR